MTIRGEDGGMAPRPVVAEPAVCRLCKGDRVLLGHVGSLTQYERPCPACCCATCEEPTDTPPQCKACAERADVEAARAWKAERP